MASCVIFHLKVSLLAWQTFLYIPGYRVQAFVYITAEFETPKNKVNQAVVWSRIVQQQKDAKINETLRFGYPYQLTDPGDF